MQIIFRMGYLIFTFLILSVLSPSYSEDLQPLDEENRGTVLLAVSHQEESKEAMPLATSVNEENKNGQGASAVGISHINSKLSEEKLTQLHDLAKNISYSKGIYRENKDTSDEPEIRRSLLKKVAVASELDIMRDIVEILNTAGNQVQLLEQLEYLVHQYDVAVNFATSGGIKLVAPLLFSSDDKIASSAASVLGSAMQSNPTVQKIAVNYGVVKNLVELLAHKSPYVLSRVIFALASLLRNSPGAQEEFIVINGVSKLVEILKNHYVTTNTKLKIVNFFNDIVIEQKTADEFDDNRNSEEIKSLKRSFEREIKKYDVCKLIPTFLDLEDLDTHQKTVAAMISLHSSCHDDFQEGKIMYRLRKLARIYNAGSYEHDPIYPEIDKELKDALYNDLQNLISLIIDGNHSKTGESMVKDEL